jgi:hypothetical protein
MRKAILLAGLILAVFLSGCVQQPDLGKIVQNSKEAKEFMQEHPEAKVEFLYLNKDVVMLTIDDIREKCGEEMEIKPYWYLSMKEKGQKLELYLDETGQKVICTVEPEEEPVVPEPEPEPSDEPDDGEDDEPEPSDEPDDECTTSLDCDDEIDCTKDTCSGKPKICENTPITECKNNDGCCLPDCNFFVDNDCDECQSPNDCSDGDPSTVDRCSGKPKRCSNPDKTCGERQWNICEEPLTCPQEFVPASDTERCCAVECDCNGEECGENEECTEDGCELLECSEFGEECSVGEACEGKAYEAADVTLCCVGQCVEEEAEGDLYLSGNPVISGNWADETEPAHCFMDQEIFMDLYSTFQEEISAITFDAFIDGEEVASDRLVKTDQESGLATEIVPGKNRVHLKINEFLAGHSLKIVIDSYESVSEENEENNEFEKAFPGPKTDLAFDRVEFDNLFGFTFVYITRDPDTEDCAGFIGKEFATIYIDGEERTDWAFLGFNRENGSEAEIFFDFDEPGYHDVRVVLDPDDFVDESNEENNDRTKTVFIPN